MIMLMMTMTMMMVMMMMIIIITTVAFVGEKLVVASAVETGLQLNSSKCKIVAQDCKIISTYKVFAHFKHSTA